MQAHASEGGRDYALATGPLNDYAIVVVKDDAELCGLSARTALGLWRRFDLAPEPLRSRVAVVREDASDGPRARFFTCGERPHPSAPLTGLAVLALAARQLGWAWLADAGALATAAGAMPLPHVEVGADGTAEIDFPPLLVRLGS